MPWLKIVWEFVYEYGEHGIPEDDIQAVYWFAKAAEQGLPNAQLNLGGMYHIGAGVLKDNVQAVYWFTKAAEQGEARAQFHLGVMYEKGEGVLKDNVQAVYWFTKAAEQGGDRDYESRWYTACLGECQSVEQGYAKAQFHLGVMYEKGEGVSEDDVQAVYWYKKAAEQGHTEAQSHLGTMYATGAGVIEDYVQAVYWYKKAAEQGHAEAQSRLGTMYATGAGVIQDYVEAYAWVRLSADNEYDTALDALDFIKKKLNSTQTQAGQQRAQEIQHIIEEQRPKIHLKHYIDTLPKGRDI